VAHALSLVGTGSGVADPAPPLALALALGTGVATADGAAGMVAEGTAEGTAVGTAVGQDSLVGTGSGVAGFPVGLADGALADAEALGAAAALGDAFAWA
jgi:hypothetical protein